MRIISAITNSFPAQVSTTFDHNYISGLIVRLIIPPFHGMQQANKLQGPIVVTSPTTFLIDIDTTFFDPYSALLQATTCAQVVPVGEINESLANATRNALPY
jgi:hypothetical protein